MSFALTTEQIIAGTKTVTRRFGWKLLKPGDLIVPVRKAMGLRKGETIERLRGPLRIVSTRWEPLLDITQEDVIREGFPQCDRCYEINHDMAEAFVKPLRSAMRRDGWAHRKGEDLCPSCALKEDRKRWGTTRTGHD